MVSKNQIKLIASLQQKKFRNEYQLFIAEGVKVIGELLDAGFFAEYIFATEPVLSRKDIRIETISDAELKKISALTVPNNCLAVFRIPKSKDILESGLILALDDIRDPGNLGTIMRLCDWFGVKQIVCSEQTADIYNPKVVQATMGSIARVNVSYVSLEKFLQSSKLPVFGTFMDGENIYKKQLPKQGIIVMGNEANGISSAIEKITKNRLSIPRFGELQKAESLNVASATGIILSEFLRNY